MTKRYNSPMLNIVSIKKNNIIATSGEPAIKNQNFIGGSGDILAPGMRGLDDYYEGY